MFWDYMYMNIDEPTHWALEGCVCVFMCLSVLQHRRVLVIVFISFYVGGVAGFLYCWAASPREDEDEEEESLGIVDQSSGILRRCHWCQHKCLALSTGT